MDANFSKRAPNLASEITPMKDNRSPKNWSPSEEKLASSKSCGSPKLEKVASADLERMGLRQLCRIVVVLSER